ncbi:MAG: M48 family metalloprotease [Alphaproteobacteria bacterium]|nr:MAG: M48 family metalloprotease [Alphaproteobacteria bacterium]
MFFLFAQHLVFDDEVELFCNEIVTTMSKEMGIKNKKIPVYLMDTEDVNAAAAGHGILLIHTGLIAECKNADEFIGVLAHELGHIQKAHTFYFYQAGKAMNIALSAGFGLGLILAPLTGGLSLLVLPIMGAGGAQSSILSYMRVHEFEADQIAVQTLKKMNWPTDGLRTFLQRLKEHDYLIELTGLTTHPLSSDRIRRIEEMSRGAKGTLSSDIHKKFSRIRAKVMGYMRKNEKTEDLYEKTQALYVRRDFANALKTIDQLLEKDKNDVFYKEMKADILFLKGDIENAHIIYKEIAEQNKDLKYVPMKIVSCVILLKSDLDAGLAILAHARAKERASPYLWHLTGHIYKLKGDIKTMWFCRCQAAFLAKDMTFVKKHIDKADTDVFVDLYKEMKELIR